VSPPIRIGTRGSALALVQVRLVASALETVGRAHEVVIVDTAGDRRAPDTAWGEGAFVAAIEQALLDGQVDVAVHSAKDVPTDEDLRLRIAAYLPRADPHDALVVAAGSFATGLADLPPGSRVGTDSPRRAAFLREARPDLEIRPLHGNVDTRLRRLDAGEADALVLAVAGLVRLGREDRITERLAAGVVPPAPGQGAIAVQVRADDERTRAAISALDDSATRLAVEAERAFLRAAGGGCRAPIGALADVEGDEIRLLGGFAGDDGATAIETISTPIDAATDAAAALATALAARVGARDRRPVVLVTRPVDESGRLVGELEARGLRAVVVPAIAIEPAPAGGPLDEAVRSIADADWAVVTSPNGARAVAAVAERAGVDLSTLSWAAVGAGTARALSIAGVADPWSPSSPRAAAIADELPAKPGSRVVLFLASLAGPELASGLRARGIVVHEVVAYRTVEAPDSSRPALERALARATPAAVSFASPSGVRGLVALASPGDLATIRALPAICFGPTTAAAARNAGFDRVEQASAPRPAVVAELAARLLLPTPAGAVT
jgi:hydroxymethylbilane synthase